MDEIIAACMNYEGALADIEDFPKSDIPVCVMGEMYSTESELNDLRRDLTSRIWITYRKNFPLIEDSTFTSDKGWGCMLRCGQMIFAEALVRLHLGRDWRWSPEELQEKYLKIIALFEDVPEKPFSIHNLAQAGAEGNKPIGEWYGPNTVAHVFRKLAPSDEWNNLAVSVVMDNFFVIDEIRSKCQNPTDKSWQPLVLFIPLRLGISEINPIYIDGIKKCLKMPQTLGLIGGKPNHALYFVGFMGNEVVYLDPHTNQEFGSLGEKKTELENELDYTYHCTYSQRMPFDTIDPSLALCFLCTSEKEFGDLCNRFRQELIDGNSATLFEMYQTRPEFLKEDSILDGAFGLELGDHHFDTDDDEEFEILE